MEHERGAGFLQAFMGTCTLWGVLSRVQGAILKLLTPEPHASSERNERYSPLKVA